MRLDRARYSTHKFCVHVWTACLVNAHKIHIHVAMSLQKMLRNKGMSGPSIAHAYPHNVLHSPHTMYSTAVSQECPPLKEHLPPTFGPICCIGFIQMSAPSGVSIV